MRPMRILRVLRNSLNALYFTAPWCQPCKTLAPIMASVTSIPVTKIDVDQSVEEATKYGVFSVPTVIVLKEDGTEAGRFSGARDAGFVQRFIASHA